MRTYYVEIVNTTDRRDNESRKVRANNKEAAIEKTRRSIRSNFGIGRCVAACGEDKQLVREFRSYCGGIIDYPDSLLDVEDDEDDEDEAPTKQRPYYPVSLHFIPERGKKGYFFAFLLDFGHSACSATGETEAAALRNLQRVQEAVIAHYRETRRKIPKPSACPALLGLKGGAR